MMILLAALSALSSSPGEEAREARPFEGNRPPVRLWMNNDRRYREGDQVRLQVDADVDGFLLVLNIDPNGRLRVLFPLDPRDDTRVQAGRRYEVRGETSDAAFRAGGDGTGLIYTAVSEAPWRFDEIVLADRWDYTRLEIDRRTTDPEPEITELVQRLAGPRGFDYDVIGYRVYGESTYSTYNTNVYSSIYPHDTYLNCYSYRGDYNSCRGWPYGGWSFGLGFYNPYYYGNYPYRYRSGYGYDYGYGYGYPYDRYRYGSGYGYPYYPNRPSNPSGRAPVLAGRPRSYTIVPRGTLGNTNRPGTAVTGPARGPSREVGAPPIDWRARGARPVRGGVGRDGPNVTIPEATPPARRARGGEYSRPPENSGRGDARPSRGEPSSREVPRDRSEPSRRGPDRSASPPRAEPTRNSAPRQAPPQASSSGNRGGSSGGHSRPRKP